MSEDYDFWSFVTAEPFGPSPHSLQATPNPVLNWFVPPLSKHSGGHLNLFRFLCGLEERGFRCNVVIVNNGTLETKRLEPAEAGACINDWYGPFNGRVCYADDPAIPPCHAAIATGWQTAYIVKAFTGALQKCYFVQDFEPHFYARGAESLFAEETYRFGFTGFTAGGWLAQKLRSEYGMRTHALGFSYDHGRYRPLLRRQPEVKHVFAYVRKETPRRGWELALLAMAQVHRAAPDVRFILAGGGLDTSRLPFPALAPGSLPVDELPDLYSQCDAAIVLSLTNLSLLPIELMACGVPVVTNSGPNVEWLLTSANAVVRPPQPDALAEGILSVLNASDAERRALRDRVIEFARQTSWEREINRMANTLHRLVKGPRLESRIALTPPLLSAADRAPEQVARTVRPSPRRRGFKIMNAET